jgi:hypothetical protein
LSEDVENTPPSSRTKNRRCGASARREEARTATRSSLADPDIEVT